MSTKVTLRRFSIVLLFFIGLSATAFSQVVKIKVLDEQGDPVVGSTVSIDELQKANITDDNGKVVFPHLPKRSYTVTAQMVGYDKLSKKINLSASKDVIVEFTLKSNTNLSEVEVFGERFKQPEKLESITRMPLRPSEQIQTISIISEKVIDEQGVLTIADAVRNVPGVTLFGSYGGVKESLSARGFRGIPVLKNGVRIDSQFQTASGITDMQGVESIQMIKGSAAVTQGVITDLGNAGGVVNIVTKTPKFRNDAQVDLRVGSWGLVRPTFDVQTVLDKDNKVAIRLNGAYERADNYRPVVSSERVYINPSIQWRPTDKTTITLEGDYMNEDRTPVTSTVNFADQDVDALYEMPYDKFLGFKNDNVNTKIGTYSASVKHYIDDKISVRAAYYGASYQVDNTSTSLGLAAPKDYVNPKRTRTLSRSLRDDKNSTFQLDLTGQDLYTGSIKHTFQVGFDYRVSDATTKNLMRIAPNDKGQLVPTSAPIDVIDVMNGDIDNSYQKVTFQNPDTIAGVNTKYNTYGIMAQEVMTINKYVKAILGVRYSSISTITSTDAGRKRDDAWDPMLGLMVSPIEAINIFGSYTTSTNLRSAGNILTDKVTRIGPSRTKQWEAGFKSDWLNNRLRFNFTYFHIFTANLSNSEYFPNSDKTTGFFYKAGDLLRDGIEVELNGRILSNLQVMMGYAYLNARYKNSPSYVEGSAPMNAPKHTANAWLYYTVNKGVLNGLSIGAGAYYVGKRPVNEYSLTPDGHGNMGGVKPFDMKAYTTVNAQLAYTYSNFTARVFFNNIFDELGYNSYFRGGYINQIDPRNFSTQVSYRF